MELEQILGLVAVLGFVAFVGWRIHKAKANKTTSGGGGGGGGLNKGGKQQLK